MKSPYLRLSHFSKVTKIILGSFLFGLFLISLALSYQWYRDSMMTDRLTQLSGKGVTVNTCAQLRDIHISDLRKTEKLGTLIQSYGTLKKDCEIIRAGFGVVSYFDPENDFDTTLVLDFSVPVDDLVGKPGSPEYEKSDLSARTKILHQINFSPAIDLTVDDITLYNNKVLISVLLLPEQHYVVSLGQSFAGNDGVRIDSWEFTTPENKTFLLRNPDRVTLYSPAQLPVLQFMSYNMPQKDTNIKICRIDLESYAKIEVMIKNQETAKIRPLDSVTPGSTTAPASRALNTQETFFYDGVNSIIGDACREIAIPVTTMSDTQASLIKKDVSLDSVFDSLGKTGLFVALFSDTNDRRTNDRIQPPIVFGVVNTHITMKTGQNGEAFFFVNDFAGKPVPNAELTVNVTEFTSQDVQYTSGSRVVTPISPLKKSVYEKAIVLGKTNPEGMLRVNLKGKIDNPFAKTFSDEYDFEYSGKYPSFFVTAQNKDTLSYLSSQWNGGIAPWNFGYTVNAWWYGDSRSTNADSLNLVSWSGEDILYTSHTFSDRLLYLPGETVSIKSILRRSLDLSAPKNTSFNLIITDNQQKEVKRSSLKTNEYGSITDTYTLGGDAGLGYYAIVIQDTNGIELGRTGFTVEVFKNPKYTTDITLTPQGLDGQNVVISDQEKSKNMWEGTNYKGKFSIQADLIGRYYNGGVLAKTPYTYKVYRQEYYDTSYWDDCYYGCFWEPNKEFYTEGSGSFDSDGAAHVTIPVEFSSSYSDYRYIFEITPVDNTGDIISSSQSVIVRLPTEYKSWDPRSSLTFQTEKRFAPAGQSIKITGQINNGRWSDSQENKYALIVKKKTFEVAHVADVRGYDRPVTKPHEELVEIIPVSKKRFSITDTGKIEINYPLPDTAEYIFEFGNINLSSLGIQASDLKDLIDEFNDTHNLTIERRVSIPADSSTDLMGLSSRCIGDDSICSYNSLSHFDGCNIMSGEVCPLSLKLRISTSDVLTGREFFSVLTYSDSPGKNPVISDNKIQVLSEKVSYKIGEKARILVRLPFTHGKVLWTVEKRGVQTAEYIDVPGNVFFREVEVDEKFTPNAYIGVLAIDTDLTHVPEYKVGYTEIVVDKSDKKALITVSADKKVYAPRETVTLSLQSTDIKKIGKKSELTVMVIDDSLISLMGNIETNTLEKIWKKLPFQIQTSITNITMLGNYYFSRPGIVGGSGSGNNKGGDSSVSSRNVFKNTAYYNPYVVTDASGKATVSFTLPDNLTQFRVIVLSQSLDNIFGSSETFFDVQKPVTLEDKTPLILRDNDTVTLGGNLFNRTGKDMIFTVQLTADNLNIGTDVQKIPLKNGANTFVTFQADTKNTLGNISYRWTATGDSPKNSDSIEGAIIRSESPTLIQQTKIDDILAQGTKEYSLPVPPNTLNSRSIYSLSISNNPLQHLSSIINSLLQYPYGCIEQSVSSTMPNVLAKKFAPYLTNVNIDLKKADQFIKNGIDRIASMQLTNGGFGYWPGDTQSNLHITPYVVRSLITMKNMGSPVDATMIDKGISYLVASLPEAEDTISKAEIFMTLAMVDKGQTPYDLYFAHNNELVKNLSRHERIAFTYGLVLMDRVKFSTEIRKQIVTLRQEFQTERDDYSWYWSYSSDKAQFAQLLMEIGYEQSYVAELVRDLSKDDYESYYMSTQSKNSVFSAFIAYIEKYVNNYKNPVTIDLNGDEQSKILSGKGSMIDREYPLTQVMKDAAVKVTISNEAENPVFINIRLKSYPADVSLIKKAEHGIRLSREISEVIDSKKLAECSNDYYYSSSEKNDCEAAFRLVTGSEMKKGSLYRITLKAVFIDGKSGVSRRNFTLEDYLPATFRVMNSKFRTNSIATNQNSTQDWYYNRIEVLPQLIMAHTDYIWSDTAEYTYFVTPEFEGTFLYPPATAYLMYNPDVHAYGEFRTIVVK